MLKIATFNLENLFARPSAMNQTDDSIGKSAIEDHAIANNIIDKENYSPADKATLIELCKKYKWHYMSLPKSSYIILQKIRGQLFKKSQSGVLSVVADGRANWVGWFDLRKEDVSWKATYNTGRVIHEVNPDILITVEIENRPTLEKFNEQVLKAQFNLNYPYFMAIDGNDERGIDLGVLSKFPIERIRSHVDDLNANGSKTFSRDCPEYDIILPNNQRIVIIPNHFKSKRNGDDQASKDRRTLQAKKALDIAKKALGRSNYVLIGGDLNDTPGSDPIKELLKDGFVDVMDHNTYPTDRPGTYNTGLATSKIDYLIMSPDLRGKLDSTGIERRGSYHPNTWKPFDTVTKASEEASDHHLVWATFNI